MSAVENNQATRETRRCALFKIDLSGRFVFIDEYTEELLKLSIDAIFGRNIEDFLDKDSNKIIQNIISDSSRYETFYEAAELCFVDSAGRKDKRSAIVSLNFIGGNPANYQIVVAPKAKSDKKGNGPDSNLERELFHLAAQPQNQIDWEDITHLFLYESGVVQSAVYLYEDKTLELAGASSDELYLEKGLNLNNFNNSHVKVAADQNVCLTACGGKQDGLHDVAFPLHCGDQSWGILRLIINDSHVENYDQYAPFTDFIGNSFFGLTK